MAAVLALVLSSACGIKGSPRPPEPSRAAPIEAVEEAAEVDATGDELDTGDEEPESDPFLEEDLDPFDEETIFE